MNNIAYQKREKEKKGNNGNLGTSITKLRSIMAIALTGGITLISTLSLSEWFPNEVIFCELFPEAGGCCNVSSLWHAKYWFEEVFATCC